VLDSLADPFHPTNLCTISAAAYRLRFISATDFGYLTTSSPNDSIHGMTQIWRASVNDQKLVPVVAVQGDVLDEAWSPDGSSLAYILHTDTGSASANQLWLKTGDAAPRAISPLIPLVARYGSVDDETIVRFSYDSKYLLMVDTLVAGPAPASPDQAIVQVHSVPDGRTVFVPPSALQASGNESGPYVTMAVWGSSTDRLYYRDQAGVHSWNTDGTLTVMFAGLAWYGPSVSPNDRLIAYYLPDGGSAIHIEVRDLISNTVRAVPGWFSAPIFISNTVMFASASSVLDLASSSGAQVGLAILPIDVWPQG
jgi:Tol biopolymer transport system component